MTISEFPPLMVLAEESENHQIFRFRGKRWAIITLVIAFGVLTSAGFLHLSTKTDLLLVIAFYTFGLLLLFSSINSFSADQWLSIEGTRQTVTFHKKNLYGTVHWEWPSSKFTGIRVYRAGRGRNWTIMLISDDGTKLLLGENEFGSLSRERALHLAEKAGRLAGIRIVE